MITLKHITEKNLNEVKDIHPGTKNLKYVSSSQETLIDAAYKNQLDYVRAIYKEGKGQNKEGKERNDNKVIGLVWFSPIKNNRVNIFRFMIDENYQGKGYGKEAFRVLINYICRVLRPKKIEIGSINPIALKLYKQFGFVELNNAKSKKIKEQYNGEILLTKFC